MKLNSCLTDVWSQTREIVIMIMHNPLVMVEQLQGTERSCINKLNIVNHLCMVTIIGQIMPWGSVKTRCICIIKCTEQVLSSSQRRIKLGYIGVYWEMICDISKGSANCSSSAGYHILKSGYGGCDSWKQHGCNSKHTLQYYGNAIFQGNLDFIFFEFLGSIN